MDSPKPTNQHQQSPNYHTSPKKPSPLGPGLGSPRASPFRRPESPSSSSLHNRTPSTNSGRATTTQTSPSKATPNRASSLQPEPASPALSTASTTVFSPTTVEPSSTPARDQPRPPSSSATITPRGAGFSFPTTQQHSSRNDPLAKLPPPLLHSMRESFAVLDRSNIGSINSADVAEVLNQLGLESSHSSLGAYFPRSEGSMNLSNYLHTLSAPLAELSRQDELKEAFAAFDPDDGGEVDVGDLREALLSGPLEAGEKRMTEREVDRVMEGFVGRRTFGKSAAAGRGDVFRYHDFLAELQGGRAGGAESQMPA